MASVGSRTLGRLTSSGFSSVNSDDSDIQQAEFNWTPTRPLANYLPTGFEIAFTVVELNGERRVACAIDSLLPWALAGDAIFRVQGHLGGSAGGCYDLMRLITTLGPHLRERIKPRNFSRADLRNPLFGSQGVLPDDFGPANGQRWSTTRMLEEGLQAARAHGIARPTLQDQIVYGIDAEAQLHPIEFATLSATELAGLVRLSTFDVSPGDSTISEQIKQLVYSRLAMAIKSKLDLPTDKFNRWFHRNFDQIIRQIAKKKRPGGPIANAIVRGAFIELVVDSWAYFAQTLECFAVELANSFMPRMKGKEREVFKALYCRSERLANRPLILVATISIAKPVIARILIDPTDDVLWGQLLRVLQTYSEMIRRRRAGDRSKKRRRGVKAGRKTELVQHAAFASEFDDLGDELVELSQLSCPCGSKTSSFETRVDSTDLQTGIVGFECRCRDCGNVRLLTSTIEKCRVRLALSRAE